MQLQRTTQHTPKARLAPKWRVLDARGQRLGRLAADAARVLQGKHRAIYSPHELTGDFVVVVNAASIDLTGNKRAQKVYYRHTGYVGHLRERTLDEMMTRFPERVIQAAVKGMLPRNRLGRRMLKRLKVYAGAVHPHEAQVNAGTGARAAARAAVERRRAEAAAASPPPVLEEPQAAPAPVAEQVAEEPERPTRRRRAAATPVVEEPQAEPAPEAVVEQMEAEAQVESAPEAVAEQAEEKPKRPTRRRQAAAAPVEEEAQAESAPEAVAEQTEEQSESESAPTDEDAAQEAESTARKKDEE